MGDQVVTAALTDFRPFRIDAPTQANQMNRSSIALFLTTLALAGGTVACGQAPEAGEEGGSELKQLRTPGKPADAQPSGKTKDAAEEGGEGGEGGEG